MGAAHWVVLGLSTLVTVAAFLTTRAQHESQVDTRFEREVERLRDDLLERMEKYDEALAAGTGLIYATDDRIDAGRWRSFAGELRIEQRFPGIRGIGVIRRVTPEGEADYLAARRLENPDFRIYPAHEHPQRMPITFVEPMSQNHAAVGLDVAHERNRREGALAAASQGSTVISGPILLVQEATQTPGFLMFHPFYEGGRTPTDAAQRARDCRGFVYAPFVVQRLLEGTEHARGRLIATRVRDAGEVIFEDADLSSVAESLRSASQDVPLYGRTWSFEYRSTALFDEGAQSSQPLTILAAGGLIDALLVVLFLLMNRAKQRAEADARSLQAQTDALLESNFELERYGHVVAHDLKEPLRMIDSYLTLLDRRIGDSLGERERKFMDFAKDGAKRLGATLEAVLEYSRAGGGEEPLERVDLDALFAEVVGSLEVLIEERGGRVEVEPLEPILGQRGSLTRLFQNLITNALKYTREGQPPRVYITARPEAGRLRVTVADEGPGIPEQSRAEIFEPLKRLHSQTDEAGTGVGLAICAKVAARHGTTLHVEDNEPHGTRFSLLLQPITGAPT